MANIDKLIPHILKWETGVSQLYRESPERLFERSRRKGWSNDPADKGGATQSGVTLKTFTQYRKAVGKSKPSVQDLKAITYKEWRDVLMMFFWDKVKAEAIKDDSVAVMIVDWHWGSGAWALKNTQKVLGVTRDGIFGCKTLAAINGWKNGQRDLFYALKAERIAYYKRIAVGSQKKWLKGWLNRVNDLRYE
jgi:lysozyme family protein